VNTFVDEILEAYSLGHRRLLQMIGDLTEEQMRWRPAHTNSIAFNLWHIARWADHMHSVLPALTPGLRQRMAPSTEIWTREELSKKWGFPTSGLGEVDTGMGMDETTSATLPLPPKDQLVAYATRAFDEAERSVSAVRDDDLPRDAEFEPHRVPWAKPADYKTVANWLIAAISHDARHIGMIEAVKGSAGMRGSASR
jgi:hypothetical protein